MRKIICVRISKSKFRSLFKDRAKFDAFIMKYRKLRFTEDADIKFIFKETHEEPLVPFNERRKTICLN